MLKDRFKSFLIRCLAFLLMGFYIPLSFGADSTTPPYSVGGNPSPVPTVIPSQSYLLDSGYVNAMNITVPDAPGAPEALTPGYAINYGVTMSGSVPSYPPTVVAGVYSYHLCPSDFIAVPIVIPTQSIVQGSEAMRACVRNFGNAWGNGYLILVLVNGVSNSSGNIIPATSFNWSVYCYQRANYPKFLPSEATISDNVACGSPATTNNAPSIILWSTGYINGPASTTAKTASFSLPRACPPNYTPYVIMHLANPNLGSISDLYTALIPNSSMALRGVGVCVTGVSGQTVSYLRSTKTTFNQTTVYESTWSGDTIYGSICDSAYTNSCSRRLDYSARPGYHLVNGVTISSTNLPLNDAVQDMYSYELYCYPPGFTVPNYSNLCTQGNYPFN